MTKLYRSLALAAVIAYFGGSAEAGMLAPIAGAFRSVLGYDKRPTPVPTQAVEIPEVPGRVKTNLDDIVTERFDSTVGDGRTVGVRLHSANSSGEADGRATLLKGGRPAIRTIRDDMTGGGAGIGAGDERTKKVGGTAGFVEGYNGGVGIGLRAQGNVGLGGRIAMRAANPAIIPAGAKTPPPPGEGR
jgi:hypothetical protein